MSRSRTARLAGLSAVAAAALLALPGVASASVNASVSGGKLTVTSDAGDAIAIVCDGTNVKVNTLDPGAATTCSAITEIEVNGGPQANNINLNGVTDELFSALTKVRVTGGGGNDTIAGSEIQDTLIGDSGHDRIVGFRNVAGTRDVMLGGEGDDTLVWNPGDGDDTPEGGPGNDTVEVNGGGGGEQFEVKASTTPGRVLFDRLGPSPIPGPFNLDIGTSEKLDFNGNGGDDTLNANGGAAGLNPFVIDADGGADNDIIQTGDAPDLLTGGAGNDRLVSFRSPAGTRDVLRGGDGDDTLAWNPGDGDDTMDGEAGSDTIEVNGGSGGEDFEVKPGAVAGRVQFDRTGPSPPGPFNLDIGSSEELQLNAGGGDDRIKGAKGLKRLISSTLNGDDGNDRITGTNAKDVLTGGKGFDLIRAADRSADQVECGGGIDLALVDRRDTVRGCELVLGGLLRVKASGKSATAAGGAAAVDLRCVLSRRCNGKVKLLHGGKSLGGAKFRLTGGQAKTVRIKLNRRGKLLAAGASSKGTRVKLRIVARDAKGNGWRTTDPFRLKG
jgi:Ca2+-binding RTX toxin-like protein